MTNTISGTVTSLVTLAGAADDPTAITASAYLVGGLDASKLSSPWTVTNAGTIRGAGIDLASAGTIVNSGSIASKDKDGVLLQGNTAAATNNSGAGIYGAAYGLYADAALSLVNAGSITGASGSGVAALAGGTLNNQAGGSITGAFGISGLYLAVTNAGAVTGTGTYDDGVKLTGGVSSLIRASVTNLAGGSIRGNTGVYGYSGGGLITVVNQGEIVGDTVGFVGSAIELRGGGSVTNQAGGVIAGYGGISGAYGSEAAASGTGALTVVNAGLIAAAPNLPGGIGVYLGLGGTVVNQSGGTIAAYPQFGMQYGAFVGIESHRTDAVTVINAGEIYGRTYAVKLASGAANRVEVEAGGTFIGTVSGGNAIGGAVVSTLELASAAVAGTISGLGTQFVEFAHITVDTGATWAASGTIVAGQSVAGAGTLIAAYGAALTLAAGAHLALSTPLAASGTLVNLDTVAVSTTSGEGIVALASGTVSNASGATISGLVALYGAGSAVTVLNDGSLAGNATASSGHGVDLMHGGYVTNQTGGHITGFQAVVAASATTIVNSGTIAGNASSPSGAGIVLTSGGSVTNLNRGLITGANGLAGYGASTVVNGGSIGGSLANGIGVKLTAGGYVDNQNTGVISGSVGISDSGAALTLLNDGIVSGNPSGGSGVLLGQGGSVSNQAGGLISGQYGVSGTGAAVTVTNAGTLSGVVDSVRLASGFANRVVLEPSAVFIGTVSGGNVLGSGIASTLELAAGTGAKTLVGLGSKYVGFGQVVVDSSATWVIGTLPGQTSLTNFGTLAASISLASGGYIDNAFGGTIVGTTTAAVVGAAAGRSDLVNAGLIEQRTASSSGVYLPDGGSVTNLSGGMIVGYAYGINATGAPATIVNAGTITASQVSGDGVRLLAGGSLTNQGGGSISANVGIVAGATATVVNVGSVTGTTSGIWLGGGGSVTNQSGGVISGLRGVYGTGAADTVVNAGRIGGAQDAIRLAPGSADRLVIDPGAVFSGLVDGGNTIGATAVSTLELAAGTVAGALAGLGAQYIDFAAITVDAGAVWAVTGTLAAGETIGGPGSVAVAGNASLDVAAGGTVAAGQSVGDSGTLIVGGTINGGATAVSLGSGTDRLILDAGASIVGTVVGGGANSTLELASGAEPATLNALGSTFVNFGTVVVDAGARWTLDALPAALAATEIVGNGGTLAIGTAGSATLNAGDTNLILELAANDTLSLPASTSIKILGGAGSDAFVATSNVLRAGETISAGGVNNTLIAQGAGFFDLRAPAVMSGIQIVDLQGATTGQTQYLDLRAGGSLTVNVQDTGAISILGNADSDIVNLGSGTATVTLGGPNETVNGGPGATTFNVTGATAGATIHGGTGANVLQVTGGGTVTLGGDSGIQNVFLNTATTAYDFVADSAAANMVIHVSLGGADTVVVGAASQSAYGYNGHLTVDASAANAGVFVRAGSGGATLDITNSGTVTLSGSDSGVVVQLTTADTLILPTNQLTVIQGSTAGGDTFVATSGVLRAGQTIVAAGLGNTLVAQGAGAFNLAAPAVLSGIQAVDLTGAVAGQTQFIDLRAGGSLTVNELDTANINLLGSADSDIVNLGSGTATVTLGGPNETVNGGSGAATFNVTGATAGATINGGTGANVLQVTGGGTVTLGGDSGIQLVFLNTATTAYDFVADSAAANMAIHVSLGGADTVVVGAASQSVYGYNGHLTVDASAANAGVFVRAGSGGATLDITNSGTVTLSGSDSGVVVQLTTADTLILPTNQLTVIQGSTAGGDTFVATNGVLRAGQTIVASGAGNTLVAQGAGTFNLAAPAVLSGIQAVDLTGAVAGQTQALDLRAGGSLTVNVLDTANISLLGSADSDIVNLGSGTATVTLGGPNETVNGGSGAATFNVTGATAGATIHGGTGANVLQVTGGGTVVAGADTGIQHVFLNTATTAYDFVASSASANMAIYVSLNGADTVVVGAASQGVYGYSGDLTVDASAANAGAYVRTGSGGATLDITTGGTVTLNASDNNLTVQLSAATNLGLGALAFLTAIGAAGASSTITAGGAHQTLESIGGQDTLVGAASFGDTFLGTSAGLNGDTIKGFGGSDLIDLTDMNFATLHPLAFNTATDALTVTDGVHSTTLTVSGSYTLASFTPATDGHTGTYVKFV